MRLKSISLATGLPVYVGNMALSRGFTVLDLLFALAIIAILMTAGLPALTTIVLESRMTAQTNGLVHAIHRARQEAHVRGNAAVICPLDRQDRCEMSGDWSRGWLLIVHQPQRPPVASPQILLRSETLEGIRLQANRKAFTFRPFEIRSTNGTFRLCDRRGAPAARAVVVSHTGRPRTIAHRHSTGSRAACEF